MNYESERAMNQKRLRMESEAHGVVQGNGLPLNYMDNGHQIPYQPYAGAYNTHYPPPEAFPGYAPPAGYAQNLSYAPPAHQNYPHHQSFAHQQQAPLHIAQPHMGILQGYGAAGAEVHKWPPQHLLPPHKPQEKPEIKLEPTDPTGLKRPAPIEQDMMGDLDQPKIKIKTDIFKPEDAIPQNRPEVDKVEAALIAAEPQKAPELRPEDIVKTEVRPEDKVVEKPAEVCKQEATVEEAGVDAQRTAETASEVKPADASNIPNNSQSTPSKTPQTTPPGDQKKRGRPKGSVNKPKQSGVVLKPNTPNATTPLRVGAPSSASTPHRMGMGRPRGQSYQFASKPFRKDFSGIQFRRRWSDDCLDSSHIPNEVYFGDVPVSMEVLFNYYDAGAERERIAAQAAQLAAQKQAAAKLAAAKLQARGILTSEVTTVDSSSDDSSSDDSDSSSDDDDEPLKRPSGRPKGSKTSLPRTPKTPSTGRRGRPPVPPDQREPGITDMKKFCKAAGIRFDYKKLTEGCSNNKERVGKMLDLLRNAGLEGKPTLENCRALKQAKTAAKNAEKQAKAAKKKQPRPGAAESGVKEGERRMTRGATGVKPRQKIVISSDEEDDTPSARRTLSKLRDAEDESASDE